jgi:DNA-binding transcriptional ArsR family regulator
MGSEIVDTLIKRGSMKAGEIKRALHIEPSVLSYHLKKLSDLGVIGKDGGYYSVEVNILDLQERWADIARDFVANLMLKGRMQGVSMEMEHIGQAYRIRVSGSEELIMEIHEVPFHEILG